MQSFSMLTKALHAIFKADMPLTVENVQCWRLAMLNVRAGALVVFKKVFALQMRLLKLKMTQS